MAAFQNFSLTGFERGCGETLDNAGTFNKTFGPMKGEYKDIWLDFFTCLIAICLISAENNSNFEIAQVYFAKTILLNQSLP